MPVGNYGGKRKLSEGYVDDIICTVKNDPSKLLREVKDLPPNLELTFEALKDKREHIACRHIATRISEHQKTDFPVEQQVSECCGSSGDFMWRVIGQCNEDFFKIYMSIKSNWSRLQIFQKESASQKVE